MNKFDEFNKGLGKTVFNYGSALAQINQINLRPLHIAGFTGAGITIAVIDTGFPTVNTGSVYTRIRNNGQIKGGYNFVNKSTDIYNTSLNNHGSYCLGTIAAVSYTHLPGRCECRKQNGRIFLFERSRRRCARRQRRRAWTSHTNAALGDGWGHLV